MSTNRPRKNAEQWSKIIEQFNQGDVSVKTFCDQNDVALSSFHKWQRRLRLQDGDFSPAFKQVITTEPKHQASRSVTTSTVVTLSISDNMVLTIQAGDATS